MTKLSIVPLTDTEVPFLRAMLYEAASWRGAADAPPVEVALRDPSLARYVEGWGRPGDIGLLARIGDRPVGAVWTRRFDAGAPGFGYVDELTPELSIAVVEEFRSAGIGRCLMTAMLAQLRLLGTAQVSLSVETDNPARHLYEQLRFASRGTADGAITMVRTLS